MTEFGDVIHPFPVERFLAEHHDRAWLHVPGEPEKTADLMSWPLLNQLLSMRVWTDGSMQLVLDRRRVAPQAYCDSAPDRGGRQTFEPVPGKVMELVRRGASLVLNEVETLHPPLLAIVEALEQGLGAKASANLYCSWQAHQAFDSHFDRHDVFALQVIGEKSWRIYQGRADNPIEHPAFLNVPQSEYDRMKGPVATELTMRPGDLLYLPRGQFHDALAVDGPSVHMTFSCSEPIGLDWLTMMWNVALQDPLFRSYLPAAGPGGPEANPELVGHLDRLLGRFAEIARDPRCLAQLVERRRGFAPDRGEYSLPPSTIGGGAPPLQAPLSGVRLRHGS